MPMRKYNILFGRRIDRIKVCNCPCLADSGHLFGAIRSLIEHRIRPHGGMDRRVLAVALHEQVGGAVDVERPDIAGLGAAELRPFT